MSTCERCDNHDPRDRRDHGHIPWWPSSGLTEDQGDDDGEDETWHAPMIGSDPAGMVADEAYAAGYRDGRARSAQNDAGRERALRLARGRAYHPDDDEMRHAARQFIGIHFGGCRDRAAAFFDEFSRATPTEES